MLTMNLTDLPESVVLIEMQKRIPPPKGFTFLRFIGDNEAKNTRKKIDYSRMIAWRLAL